MSLLDSVGNWDSLGYWFNISRSKYIDIIKQHSNATERNKALCEWYLTNHPAPSWRHIAEGLYGAGEHEVLEVLRDQVHYFKGGLSIITHKKLHLENARKFLSAIFYTLKVEKFAVQKTTLQLVILC